jgi:hypothetical protein
MAVPASGLILYIDYQQSILCDIGCYNKAGIKMPTLSHMVILFIKVKTKSGLCIRFLLFCLSFM